MSKVTGYFPTRIQPASSRWWRSRKSSLMIVYAELKADSFGERRRLRRKLGPILDRYKSARATWDATPEKAELREWLNRVDIASSELAELLAKASDTARAIVHDGDHWGSIEAQMLVVSMRARRAIQNLPPGTGRERDAPFQAFVAEVANLYANIRGKRPSPFSLNPHTGTYDGPFFRLARALLSFIDLADQRDDSAFAKALQRALNGQKAG
jgi:hypothetical protein